MQSPRRWVTLLILSSFLVSSSYGLLFQRYKQLFLGSTQDVPTQRVRRDYDFIVIGSGPGGATIANRLTEVPSWNVLLIEAGDEEVQVGQMPAMTPYLQHTRYNWGYKTEPENNACLGMNEGRCKLHAGKGTGGTSILSYMIYTRGHPRDYDKWDDMGNKDWNWDAVLPYFLKSEGAKGDIAQSEFHSKGGYLDVDKPYITPITNSFLNSSTDLGYPNIDYNSGEQMGFSMIQTNLRNGSRCSANRAFLRPIRKRRNLHVIKNSLVTKILIDPVTRKTLGVEFQRGGRYVKILAKREVILSAGAINTPKILMLSGIGPREHLKSVGIPIIKNLSGVGKNLQDHVSMSGLAFLVNETVTMVHNRLLSPSTFFQYYVHGSGPLTSINGISGLGYVRTPLSDKPFDYPDIELLFMAGNIASDGGINVRKGIGIRDEIYDQVYGPMDGLDAWSIWPMLLQPKSRGYIQLYNKHPFSKPKIFMNYLKDEHDILTLVEGIKISVALSNSSAFQKYDSTLHDIALPPCKSYIFTSDDYWRCAAQQLTTPAHDLCCTAKMGPENDTMAVVNSELKVHGIRGLRVVDASIMPNIPAAHTMAPTYMIAEKAADLIKKAHGFGN